MYMEERAAEFTWNIEQVKSSEMSSPWERIQRKEDKEKNFD